MLQRNRPLPDPTSKLDAPRGVSEPSLDRGVSGVEILNEERPRSGPSDFACTACEAMQGNDAHYAQRVLPDPRHLVVNAQAIADAVGFCHLHGGYLLAAKAPQPAAGTMMLRALGLLRPLFEARSGTDDHALEVQDHVLEILFAARSICPACTFSERRLTGALTRYATRLRSGMAAAEADALCLPHFRALIGLSSLSDLADWVEMEARTLGRAEWMLDTDDLAVVRVLTRLVAGQRRQRAKPGAAANIHCSVCIAMREARAKWLEQAAGSVRVDAAPALIMPSCPEHIWDCHGVDDSRLAAYATQNAFRLALHHLRRAAILIRQEERKLEESRKSVWYKKKSPAYILGQRRAIVSKIPGCAACKRIAVARDRAVGRLIEELAEKHKRDAFERSQGLCVKHYALTRIIAPAGPVRETLTGTQLARLSEIQDALSSSRPGAWRDAAIYLSDGSRL